MLPKNTEFYIGQRWTTRCGLEAVVLEVERGTNNTFPIKIKIDDILETCTLEGCIWDADEENYDHNEYDLIELAPLTFPLKVGDRCRTRNGEPVVIVQINEHKSDNYTVGAVVIEDHCPHLRWFTRDGKQDESNATPHDIVAQWGGKIPKKGYLNIYHGGAATFFYATREEADLKGSSDRVACIRVDWDHNQFDD